MKDLVEALKKPLNGYQVIDIDHWAGSSDNGGTHIILDAKKADAATRTSWRPSASPPTALPTWTKAPGEVGFLGV